MNKARSNSQWARGNKQRANQELTGADDATWSDGLCLTIIRKDEKIVYAD